MPIPAYEYALEQWHTTFFRTLNEARRIEADRRVNGAMWELITAGYANIMTLGIRKFVDRHPDTDSVWNVISQIERRPESRPRAASPMGFDQRP